MKWIKRFSLPVKSTLVFIIAIYLPLIVASFAFFRYARVTEKEFGLKLYKRFADLDLANIGFKLNRIQGELMILYKDGDFLNLVKMHEENPSLNFNKLIEKEKYKILLEKIEKRLRLIMSVNSNLYGISLYVNFENIMALNESKLSHGVSIKYNVPIPNEIMENFKQTLKNQPDGFYFYNSNFVFPFDKQELDLMDTTMVFQHQAKSAKELPFYISFYCNPFVGVKEITESYLKDQALQYTLILKEKKDEKPEDFNTKSNNTNLITNIITKLPEPFLKKDSDEIVDNNSNIYTIRKIKLGLKNMDKFSIVSFYPAKIIRGPLADSGILTIKILVICSIFIIPFLFFALKFLTSKLRLVTKDLNKTIETLEKSTKEMEDISFIIKKSNNENKNRVNEISSTMHEIIITNKTVKGDILEMSSLSKKTSTSAREGRNDLNELTISMEKIIESSRNISKIINIIENIAMQTNILSMNASVEAARAGEHGKGFTVVAQAIRDLANKSSEAGAEIGKQIEESIGVIGNGSQKVGENRAKFHDIIEHIEKLNQIVENSSRVLGNRMEESDRIANELKKINIAVSDASTQTEKNGEIAVKLSHEAESLKESIHQIHSIIEGEKNPKL